MAMQTFALSQGRLNKYKGEIISHAVVVEVLGRYGRQVQMPQRVGDTYISRRYMPYGASTSSPNTFFPTATGDRGNTIVQAHLTAEGVTPPPESIVPMDVTMVPSQYSCLYGFTDKTFYLHEDDIPKEMIKQVGERVALVNEMIDWGVLRSCTNQYFGGTASAVSIATVDGPVSLGLFRRITRSLHSNHAKPVNTMLKAGAAYGTDAVAAGYTIFCHTDLEQDVRDLPGFIPVEKYATGKAMEHELGKVERMRFIMSPDLPSYQDAGAAVGSTGCLSTSASNIDVYPFVVMGQDSWSQLSVRGLNALNPTYLPPGQKTKSDPFGQRGYAGTIWWKGASVENNGWMAVGFVGARTLQN